MVRVKMWGKSSQDLIVILNLGKPYGLKGQIYWGVFSFENTKSCSLYSGGRSFEFISDDKPR